jgi:cytochrome oxidase Cu insertion factor (SCO1/SenC/PrrC family)
MKSIQSIILLLILLFTSCSKSDYGFSSNKSIGNLLLATDEGKKEFYSYRADGYIFFFGYSRCNTTCPMGLQAFYELYENPKFPKGVIPVFVSIDLARETWESLHSLKQHYGERIIFILPETKEELRNLTKEFNIQFSVSNPTNPNSTINHTGNLYFVDSEFKLSRIFTSNQRDMEKIANEITNYYIGKEKEKENENKQKL